MATFSKRYNNWHARVRKNNKVITKTFSLKKNAIRWAKEIELKIEKGIFEDINNFLNRLKIHKKNETKRQIVFYSSVILALTLFSTFIVAIK